MCLVLFAWKAHPRYPLVLAANRDEFHQRPTAPAEWWDEPPGILAGRDLQAGGTWMGVNATGRFAALTNYREPGSLGFSGANSRGELVCEYLAGVDEPMDHARKLAGKGEHYSGFNLLVGSLETLAWVSNRGGEARSAQPGIHGLSNHLLNTDWPKVHDGRQRLAAILDNAGEPAFSEVDGLAESVFGLLTDTGAVEGDLPPSVDPDLAADQLVRHYFIKSPEYGTRSSTVLLIERSGDMVFEERRFSPSGRETGRSRFELRAAAI